MNSNFIRSLLLTSSLASAAVLSLASPVRAADLELGGGSTLAEPIYSSEFGLYNLFVSSTPTFEYCGVGSGSGQTAFIGNAPASLLLTSLQQYDAAVCKTVTSANRPVVFGASDATLSSSQISTYNSTRVSTDGPIIQIPTLGTAITIPVKNASVTTNGGVVLTDKDLCNIFAGNYTNFSQITNHASVAAGALTVAYRSDSSGTTFLLTQHLAAVCGNYSVSTFSGGATKNFSTLITAGHGTFVGASGSQGVQALLTSGSANIGYLSPDYTAIATNSPSTNKSLYVASVTNANTSTAFLPNVSNTVNALGTATAPNTSALAANPANWVPAVANPTTGYPIVGYTTWDLATCYNAASTSAATDITSFLTNLYGGNTSMFNQIGSYGFANVPTAFATAIKAVFITNTSYTGATGTPYNLNINTSAHPNAVCTGKTGRSATN